MEDKQLKVALQPTADCLSIEQLGRYQDDALTPAAREITERHVRGCANCQTELALLDAFSTLAVREDEAEVVRDGVKTLERRRAEIFGKRSGTVTEFRRRFSVAALRPVFAMAAVLLMIVGGYYLTQNSSRNSSGIDPDATRSSKIIVEAPSGDVQSVPEQLQWKSIDGASSYRIRITEVDRHELWSTDTTTSPVTLPPSVRAQIVPGKTLVWQVTAYGAANKPIAESTPQRFRVAR
jgi:putative zinc finger protein